MLLTEQTSVDKNEPYDKDGDGHESVSEYIEKKKITSNADNVEEEQKTEKKNKQKEELEKFGKVASGIGNTIGNVASVATAIPHIAAFGLGAGSASLAKMFADYLKDKANKK